MLKFDVFAEGMYALCAIFEREPNKILLNAYYAVLKGLSDEQFRSAVTVILKTKKFFKMPLPAELLEMVNGRPQDAAILALEKVERAIREVGSYCTVVFDDPVIHRTIESFEGGWQGICEMPLADWKFARKDFIKMYEAFSVNPGLNAPVKLIGRIEHMNGLNGRYHKSQEAKYIGDKAKALAWTSQVRQIENPEAENLVKAIG